MAQVEIDIDTANLDAAIEKANRLVELLQEASRLIGSLGRCQDINLDADYLGKAICENVEEIADGIYAVHQNIEGG